MSYIGNPVKLNDFIIKSILDTDLYKITMQQAVLELYPNAQVEYRFKNRGPHRFNENMLEELRRHIQAMETLRMSPQEEEYISSLSFFKPSYVEYLKNYKFNSSEVSLFLTEDNDLDIKINGLWHSAIMWEVPLMALISELYFSQISPSWMNESLHGLGPVLGLSKEKADRLSKNNVSFADFGTRRRRSRSVQESVVAIMAKSKSFVGTSNVKLAIDMNLNPIGTMAHEFISGVAALDSINRANYYALHKWQQVYNGDLGIALTDTYGTESFFRDFDAYLSKLYDGVRHDSGDPFVFGEKVIEHYKQNKIDPMSKTVVFSDGLDTDLAIKLNDYFANKIKVSFGIGTHFSNDFPEYEKPLNMVIKLWKADEKPVVKLSENPGKAMGEEKAIEMYKYIYGH